jgi:hypothetical protein
MTGKSTAWSAPPAEPMMRKKEEKWIIFNIKESKI